MYPNPQDALPLSERPKLKNFEELAEGLRADHPTLAKARFAIARTYGFESWPKFSRHVEALGRNSPVYRFESAADAIVNGDPGTLRDLLRADRKLVHARSGRVHAATLLIYVSANGVENYRQKTPKNIVEVAGLLLDAGAEVDAAANVYGGGCATLELVATSVHPERAGVQLDLLQTLIDRGASLEKPSLIAACLGNGRQRAAEFLATHGARIDLAGAAGLGHLDTVRTLIDRATAEARRDAFLYACAYGRNGTVEFLLEKGADLNTHRADGQTALHWAVIGGHPETVKLLLRHGAPLEMQNIYRGTVLGQTLWSAAHGGDPNIYLEILDALEQAGAKIPERHIPVNAQVDSWLAARGSVAESG
jgi:hypothetical protein